MRLLGAVKNLTNRDINANKLSSKKGKGPNETEISPENIQLEVTRPSYDQYRNDDNEHVYDNAAYSSDSSEESEVVAENKDATTC